jgi:hypothetical protein
MVQTLMLATSHRRANLSRGKMPKDFKEHASRQQGQGMLWNLWWRGSVYRSSILPSTHYLTSTRQGFLLLFEQVTFSIDVQATLVVNP